MNAPSDVVEREVTAPTRHGKAERWAKVWAPVLVPTLIVLVGAWTYRWVAEDAFIDFRVIQNLLAGHGPVYNVGERVEVYSDPLWLVSLTALTWAVPRVAIEWWSILLGLSCSVGGVVLAARGTQRLAARDGASEGVLVLPLGMLIFAVVAGVWEFATSGLEMGMVFLWIGLSWWLLVRLAERRVGANLPAFVVGLGPLIRPELALMALVDLVAIGFVISLPGWKGPSGRVRRFLLPLVSALAVPCIYQLWRMAYFALVVSNTALAKNGGAWWAQGFRYLSNFVGTYLLWVPFLAAVPIVAARGMRWCQRRDAVGVVVLLTPIVGGLADALYVTEVGGDYMAARLLLPAFMSGCLVIWFAVGRQPSWQVPLVIVMIVWSAVCLGWLRYGVTRPLYSGGIPVILSERDRLINQDHTGHPIIPQQFPTALSSSDGSTLHRIVSRTPPGHQLMYLGLDPLIGPAPARSALPFRMAVDDSALGVRGYLAGPLVYFYDGQSLANPIGSHVTVHVHIEPGHLKPIGPEWMVARFGLAGQDLPFPWPDESSVEAARRAMSCQPLSSYLHAITAPLGAHQILSNIEHSLSYTRMTFSPNPVVAERELCGDR